MWAYYGGGREGFCIEFKAEKMPARKVEYKEQLPAFNMASPIAEWIVLHAIMGRKRNV